MRPRSAATSALWMARSTSCRTLRVFDRVRSTAPACSCIPTFYTVGALRHSVDSGTMVRCQTSGSSISSSASAASRNSVVLDHRTHVRVRRVAFGVGEVDCVREPHRGRLRGGEGIAVDHDGESAQPVPYQSVAAVLRPDLEEPSVDRRSKAARWSMSMRDRITRRAPGESA